MGEEVYLRTLDDFKAFSDRVTLPDFWETSRPKVVDDAFGKVRYWISNRFKKLLLSENYSLSLSLFLSLSFSLCLHIDCCISLI